MDFVASFVETEIALAMMFVTLRWVRCLHVVTRCLRWTPCLGFIALVVDKLFIAFGSHESRGVFAPRRPGGSDLPACVFLVGGFVISAVAYTISCARSLGRMQKKIAQQMSFYMLNYFITFSPLVCFLCWPNLKNTFFDWVVVEARGLNGFLNTFTYFVLSKYATQTAVVQERARENQLGGSFRVAFGGEEVVGEAEVVHSAASVVASISCEDEDASELADTTGFVVEIEEAEEVVPGESQAEKSERHRRQRSVRIAALVNAADWAWPPSRPVGQPAVCYLVYWCKKLCRQGAGFCSLLIIDTVLTCTIIGSLIGAIQNPEQRPSPPPN